MRSSARVTFLSLLVAGVAGLSAAPARAAEPTAADCVAASEQGLKLREGQKLRDARAQFLVCASPSCPEDVRAECARHVTEATTALPTVVFEVKNAAGDDVTTLKISMDGAPLVDRLDGAAIPIDPGEHVFLFEADGEPPVQKTILVREGEKDRREAVTLGAVVPSPLAPEAAGGPPVAVETTPVIAPESGSTQKRVAGVLVGAGVVSLGVGAAFFFGAKSTWSNAQSECPSATNCPDHAQAVSDHDSAASSATVATVAFAGGATLTAVGAVLWVFASSPKATMGRVRVLPTLGAGSGGAVLVGTF